MITKSELSDQRVQGNELKTRMYVDRGKPMVRLSAETQREHKFQRDLPIDTLVYWYPLYFYYTWSYNYAKNKLEIKVNDNPPKSLTSFLKEHPNFNFDSCIDSEGKGIIKDNRIFQDNFELMQQFKQMQLKTFTEFFNRQEVTNNFKLLEELQVTVWGEAYTNYLKDHDDTEIINPNRMIASQYSKERFDQQVYAYLTDNDKRLLIRIGCAQVMTMKMADILRAQDK